MERIDLVLVNPGNKRQMHGELSVSISAIEPPLWLGLIAAFVRRKGFSVKIIDADALGWGPQDAVEKIIEYNPHLAVIGVLGATPSASSTPKMPAVSNILNILKSKSSNIKTMLYGIHPSALPERTLKEEKADFICRGEGFKTIIKFLEIIRSGDKVYGSDIKGLWYMKDSGVVSGGWSELVENLDELPFAAWDLLPMEKYRAHNWHCFGRLDKRQPYAVIYTSLGCPFNCVYCNIHALYNGTPGIRFRSITNVVEEIDFLVKNYRVQNIKILDELFVCKEGRVTEFCDLIIPREYGLNIWAYARIDTVNDKMLKKMKQAGINWLAYGIEAGNSNVRRSVMKGNLGQDIIKKVVDMTHRAGIHIVANFVFGLPEDDFQSMKETLDLAKELNCEYTNFYAAMAYPGSQLYKDALEQGLNLPDSWAGYAQFSEETVPLPTKHLSSAQVLSFRDEAFGDFHNSRKYLEMIEDKFGVQTVKHIKQMLNYKIKRKLLTGSGL
ncbi:MAG: radical SAM protein [Candidatus Omnitrophota bacterium]